ncbi:TPA: hypothetical protein ACXPX7_005499, partial [Klebsiella pneumoniae]
MICPPEILVMHTVILFRRQIKEAAAINFHDSRNMPVSEIYSARVLPYNLINRKYSPALCHKR